MIETLIACGLFTAPIWGNIYLWIMNGSNGFEIESLACALFAIVLFMTCILLKHGPLTLPLHAGTQTVIAFGATFTAVDLRHPIVYIRCAILLGFHAALLAVFLYDSNKKEKGLPGKVDI